MTNSRALVVCIGNELVADDAVGFAIFNKLTEAHLADSIRIEYCSVGGIALLEFLTGHDELMIVADAVQLGAPPGTIRVWPWDELPTIQNGSAISAHGIGLQDTISIGLTLYPERMPKRILLVGIEGCCFDELGSSMTPAVAASVPAAVTLICNELSSNLCEALGEYP